MSTLEDEIRDALRSEAGRLREVRPLRLEPAAYRLAPGPKPRRARRPRAWLAPATAAALVIALAVALVAARVLQGGSVPPAVPQPPAPTTFPRYYVGMSAPNEDRNATSLVVGDSATGKTLRTIPAPKGASFNALSAAADDRTFVVAQTLGQRKPPYPPWATTGPTGWYLLRILPGSAGQVTMTKLAITSSAADPPVMDTALSGDGRYLAVAFGSAGTLREDLRVYSVATGQLVHAWTMVNANVNSYKTLSYLSWVNGDKAVAFTFMWAVNTRQEVRTLAVSAPGTDLLAGSRVVWSQYAPGNVNTYPAPRLCSHPNLTTDGQTVTCWQSAISAPGEVPATVWLAYSISSPAKPRVIASVPPVVTKLPGGGGGSSTSGTPAVYVSATEVIGYSFAARSGNGPVTIHEYLASGTTVRWLGTGTIATLNAVW